MDLYRSVVPKIKKLLRHTRREVFPVKQEQILEVVPTKKTTQFVGSNWLIKFSTNKASEHGEDGIITKIFEILPPQNKWVCEFGAHDPEIISNTWRLIHQEGWNALLIEADPGYYEKLKAYYKNSKSVHCVNTKVSYEGIEKLDAILKNTPVPADLDFMVIDIDGNDYHVWEAIETYQAKVVMIEFNASIPVDVSFVQEPNLNLNQGSSLKAMVELAKKKNYKLIAVTAWNAFFVQEKYFHLFHQNEPPLENMYVFPAKHPIWMRTFQLYDGTLVIAPWNEMLWHKINLTANDYQILPSSLRFFSRELAYREEVIEKTGEKRSVVEENAEYLDKIFKMPGNVLGKYAKNIHSHYGEDGILEKIVALVSSDNHFLVDVGAWDGVKFSKSRNLTTNHHWQALLLENDPIVRAQLSKNYAGSHQVTVAEKMVGCLKDQTLDYHCKKNNVPREFDLLILNNYGMEYYLWESLHHFSPKAVVVQFNPTVPNDVTFVQARDATLHQGCSLRALCNLAHYKGYELAAVTLETAFFIKRKYYYRFFEAEGLKLVDLDDMFCPVQMYLFQLYDGTLAFSGLDRLFWNGIRIDQESLQVVPKALRKFHQFADPDNKKFFYRV